MYYSLVVHSTRRFMMCLHYHVAVLLYFSECVAADGPARVIAGRNVD